ncbi:MAG TPA: hypothetical protein VF717_09130 [Pyrinomonadaceae bacterium]|jgi:threonine dehydrogenase-like Zn-dependent dehydrogenase
MNRSLTMKTGQCHVQRYWKKLLEHVERGDIDPSFVITHRIRLEGAPHGFDIFTNKDRGLHQDSNEALKPCD